MTNYSLQRGLSIEKDKIIVSHINIRQSISILIIKLICLDVAVAVLVGAMFLSLNFSEIGTYLGIQGDMLTFIIFSFLAIIKIAFSIYIVLDWINEYYELTPRTFIYRHGIFFTKEERINFADIRKLVVKQGLLGKLLNFGTIEIYDFLMQKTANAYLIHNPLRYEKILTDLIPEVEEEKNIIREKIYRDED